MILLTLASLAIVLLAVSIYNKLKTDNISLINIILNKDNEHTHITEGFEEDKLRPYNDEGVHSLYLYLQ